MLDVLVYSSWGPSGLGVMGHVLGTSYTFEITTIDPALDPGSNSFAQLGTGFVFEGDSTSGFDDTLVYSQGNGATPITLSSNGDLITDPWGFSQFAGEVVFLGNSPAISGIDNELYLTNGTGAPELLLPVGVQGYTIVASTLYALAQDNDIYRVNADGSYQIVMDSDAGSLSLVPSYMFEFDDALYFRGRVSTSSDYYRIDPVTDQVVELNIAEANDPNELAIGNTQFFFWNFASATGHELYVSDGTSAGTHLVLDIQAGTSSSYNSSTAPDPRTIGDSVVFLANDGGSDGPEFWVSDGTIPGTFRLTGTGTPAGELDASNANATITVGNQVFFTAYRPNVGTELFVTDGTINGTHLVADLFPGTASSAPRNFATDGTYLYFSVSSGPDLEAVWVSDGTEAGTQILSVPGGSGSTSASMITVLQLEQENLPPRTFLGTTDPDTFNGEFLDEIFHGLDGDDTLNGGLGDDMFYGGSGADDIDGGGHGAGGDTASYQGSDAAVTINLGNGAALGGHAAGDTLTGIENVEGSDHADTIYGDAGNNILRGGAGDDTLAGQGGDDQLFGGQGNDSLSGGNDNDTIHGEDGNDRIFANAGNDTINGGAGDDFTNGGDGDDTINGGADDDNVLVGGNGSDTIHGDDGSDGINGSAGNDFLHGDLGNDRIYGGTGLDQMWGGEGDDTMGGLGDDDQMWGGDGADGMNGGGGNDTMHGEAGNDRLYGGLGADTLVGGADDDLLVGQGGIDTFVFEANWGHDQISGYGLDVTGQAFVDEVIDMSALGITFADLTIEQSGVHTLVYITADGSANNSIEILYRNVATITQDDIVF